MVDCESYTNPTGPAVQTVIKYSADEQVFYKDFVNAWKWATENGQDVKTLGGSPGVEKTTHDCSEIKRAWNCDKDHRCVWTSGRDENWKLKHKKGDWCKTAGWDYKRMPVPPFPEGPYIVEDPYVHPDYFDCSTIKKGCNKDERCYWDRKAKLCTPRKEYLRSLNMESSTLENYDY